MGQRGVYSLLTDFHKTILLRINAFGLFIRLSTAVTGLPPEHFTFRAWHLRHLEQH